MHRYAIYDHLNEYALQIKGYSNSWMFKSNNLVFSFIEILLPDVSTQHLPFATFFSLSQISMVLCRTRIFSSFSFPFRVHLSHMTFSQVKQLICSWHHISCFSSGDILISSYIFIAVPDAGGKPRIYVKLLWFSTHLCFCAHLSSKMVFFLLIWILQRYFS